MRQELQKMKGDIRNMKGDIFKLQNYPLESQAAKYPPGIIDGNGKRYSGGVTGCLKWMIARIDRHYLIIVVVGFAFNFALWMCMMFLVFKIEKNKVWWYNVVAWAIFLAVVLLVLALIWRKLLVHLSSDETTEAADDSHPKRSDQSMENGETSACSAMGPTFKGKEPTGDNGKASASPADGPSSEGEEQTGDKGKTSAGPAGRPSSEGEEQAGDNGKISAGPAEGPSSKGEEPAGDNDSNGALQRGRFRFLARIASIATELLSFTMVIVYFYKSAVQQYNSPIWELEVDIHDSIELPAAAVIGNYGDAVSATLDPHWLKCFFPSYTSDNSTSCAKALNPTAQPLNTARYGQTLFYNFNLPRTLNFTTQSKELLLQTQFTCKCFL